MKPDWLPDGGRGVIFLSEHRDCKGWDKKVVYRVEHYSWTDIINITTPNIASYRGHKPANLTPV